MSEKIIHVKIFRFDPSVDKEHYYKDYEVPYIKGMSVMDVLDYIYQNIDGTLAYYDHAGCSLGICGRCVGRINGRSGLFCQTLATEEMQLDPLYKDRVLKDLVMKR